MFLIRVGLLSFTEDTSQGIRPTGMLVLVVKPVLLDQRNDLVLHDFFHPVFGAIMRCAFAEVAVSYTKVAPKRSVGCYGSVQLFDLFDQRIEGLVVESFLVCFEALRVKPRLHFEKAE